MCRHHRPRAEMIEVAERIDTHNARARRSRSTVSVFKVLRACGVHCGRFPRAHWRVSAFERALCALALQSSSAYCVERRCGDRNSRNASLRVPPCAPAGVAGRCGPRRPSRRVRCGPGSGPNPVRELIREIRIHERSNKPITVATCVNASRAAQPGAVMTHANRACDVHLSTAQRKSAKRAADRRRAPTHPRATTRPPAPP